MINKSRVTFIEELQTFINSKQKELNSVLDALGWTEESMKEDVRYPFGFSSNINVEIFSNTK